MSSNDPVIPSPGDPHDQGKHCLDVGGSVVPLDPGDTLLLISRTPVDLARAERVRCQVESLMPGVTVEVLGGFDAAVAYRPHAIAVDPIAEELARRAPVPAADVVEAFGHVACGCGHTRLQHENDARVCLVCECDEFHLRGAR